MMLNLCEAEHERRRLRKSAYLLDTETEFAAGLYPEAGVIVGRNMQRVLEYRPVAQDVVVSQQPDMIGLAIFNHELINPINPPKV